MNSLEIPDCNPLYVHPSMTDISGNYEVTLFNYFNFNSLSHVLFNLDCTWC